MANLKILNKKEVKFIHSILEKQWGFNGNLDYVFMISEKDRMYIINKKFGEIDISRLRVDTLGMYFGELKGDAIRVSIEGSQIIGPFCSKNIIDINDGLMKLWMHGYDIEVMEKEMEGRSIGSIEESFVLIRYKNDFLGCGRLKEDKIINYVPKVRRIRSEN